MVWRAIAVGVLALGAGAVVLSAIQAPLFDLDRFALPKELALHATALAGLCMLRARREIELGVVGVALLGFAAWSALSATFATNHWLAIRATALTASGVVVFVLARAATRDAPRARVALVAALVGAAMAAGVSGVVEAHGWDSPLWAATRAPGGLLGNRNFLAHLLVLALPLAAWLLLGPLPRPARPLGALAVAVLAVGIVLSRSRAAWLGAGAELATGLVVLMVSRVAGHAPRWRGRGPMLAAGAAIGVAFALLLPNQLAWKSSTPYADSLREVLNYRSGSGRGRLIQFENSIRLVRLDPVFGTGPGNWPIKYPLVTTPGDPSFNAVDPMPTNPWPSSDWVALVAERGVTGLLLFGAGFAGVLLIAVRRFGHPDADVRLEAGTAAALAAGAIVMGLFDAVLLLAPPTMLVMAGLGALLPVTRTIRVSWSSRPATLAWLGLLLVVGAGAIRAALQIQAMREAGPGTPRNRLEAALRYDPVSYRLRVLHALRAPCPAAEHARRAASQYPYHDAPRTAARRCGAPGARGRQGPNGP